VSGAFDDLKKMATDLVAEVGERAGIAGIKDALGELEVAGRKHRVEAIVTSAVPLTGGERQQLETRLKARYGDDMPISYQVEPAILGGLTVRVGDRLIDGSVASKLGQLRQQMTGQ
jgi:F-type H+-transporting ATPase subunit delta